MKESRIAVKGFIVNKDRLLIIKRSSKDVQKPGIWEIPGGRLEIGEDPFLGLKRETKEETGLEIEVLQPISVRHFVRDDKQAITMIIFLCSSSSTEVILSKEHTEYEWTPINKAKEKIGEFFWKEIDVYNKINYPKLHPH